MPSALIALDEQLYVTQWNQEATALSGTRLDEALNQPIFLAFQPLKPYLPQIKATVEQHTVERIERVTWIKDDEAKHYALTFYPLMGGAGRGVVIRIDDITQRLSLEEMMVQYGKMLSVGGLAAGMAHEINNPLGAILHNVQNIRRRLSPDLPKTWNTRNRRASNWRWSTATCRAAKSRNCSMASSKPAHARRRSSRICSASAAAAIAKWRLAICRR